MHRFILPKISALFFLTLISVATGVIGQTKPLTEISVSKCWSYSTPETGSAIVSDAFHVFVGTETAKVEALSLDGKKFWASDLGGEISSNLVPSEKGLLLVTSGGGSNSALRNLSKDTGITSWTLKLPDAERYFLGLNSGSVIVVSKSGTIEAVDTADGSIKWKRDIADGFVAEPVFTAFRVIVAAKANQIFSVSITTGEIESLRRSVYPVTSLGTLPSGEIIAGDERGNVSTLTGTDKPLWKFKSGGEISRIFVNGENILATSHDNFVYYLFARNGDVDWKKRLAGRVLQLGLAERYVLTMSFEENSAVFTELSTGKVAGQIAFAADEKLAAPPVFANGAIYMLTGTTAYSYSLGSCTNKKETVADKPSATVHLK